MNRKGIQWLTKIVLFAIGALVMGGIILTIVSGMVKGFPASDFIGMMMGFIDQTIPIWHPPPVEKFFGG
ncbi:MAG: hypothetical protein SVS85_04545 [Candidatus Nanohaloarchaea archaeon]|nr:hypothetical protein [Candidatus Nanohaloarchaea archaeon]